MEYGHRNPTVIVPLGFKFRPNDFELIQIYLKNKLMNSAVPLGFYNPFVEVDIYNHNPQELVGMHAQLDKNQESWYFFTTRERKYQNGKRPQRIAKGGYWKSIAKDTEIVHNRDIIGFKRVLDFYSGDHSKGKRTDWKMHEYLTAEQKYQQDDPSASQNPMMLNDCVLCKIYKNRRNKRKNRDDDEQESLNNVRMKLLMVQPDESVQLDDTEVNYMNDQPQEQEHGAIFIPNYDNSHEINYQFSDENPAQDISSTTNDVMNGVFGLPNQTNNIISEYSWSTYDMGNQITDLMIGDEVLLTTGTELMALPPLEDDEQNKQVDDEWFKSTYIENQINDLTVDDELLTTGMEHMLLPPLEDEQSKQVDDDEWFKSTCMENQIIDLKIDGELLTTGTEHMALPPLEDEQNKKVVDDDEWLQALKADLQS